MMAEFQVIIVKEAQNIRAWDALEKYFEKPVKSTILVICYKNGTIDRRKKMVSIAEKQGVVFESKKKRDYELPAFINAYLKERGATIDNKSAQMMADQAKARRLEPTFFVNQGDRPPKTMHVASPNIMNTV